MKARDPHKDAGVPRPRPGEGTLPKPSRDDAVAAGSTEEMKPGASGDQAQRYATGRRDAEDSGKGRPQPPHVTENDETASLQDEHESPGDVPVLPANAAGEDQVSTEDQPTSIDEESAYDRRPEEDKGWKSRDP
jgi:hypothetical protein